MNKLPEPQAAPIVAGDGIVDGSGGDDRIDLAYDGDPQGDRIDNGDAILPGAAPDDDVVDAGAGDDTIRAGQGDDIVYAGSGSDVVGGESGDDTLYGDSNLPGRPGTLRESFRWKLAPDPDDGGELDPGDDLSGGFTQDTGHVRVAYSAPSQSPAVVSEFSIDREFVDGIDTGGGAADRFSALGSVLNGAGNSAEYDLGFSDPVSNVCFRINDVDGDGVVRVMAWDADGNPIAVDLTAGAGVTLYDRDSVAGNETADSNGGYEDNDSPDHSVLVEIPGPVARLSIQHDQNGPQNSGITVTDVFFDVSAPDTGVDGDDVLDGGQGDDILYGEGGDDTLLGGQGDDLLDGGQGRDYMYGGADRDTFVNVTQGDRVDGGEGFTISPDQDFDTLDLTGAAQNANSGGSLFVEYSAVNPEDGIVHFLDAGGAETGTVAFQGIELVVPCFTPGTLIATPMGERRVEDLRAGDRVITRDNGIQEIRWAGRRDLSGADLARSTHLNPVRIRAGALGNGLPERDMQVSPNHRLLVANDKTALYFDDREVLAAAKDLTALDGIDTVRVREVAYLHFMFDQHEVVLSDGAWTESFQPGDLTLAGMDDDQRDEIFELFPEFRTREGVKAYSAARRSLKRHEARLLTH